jgi:hypothetical protein
MVLRSPATELRERKSREKDAVTKSRLSLALKLQLQIDKRSERLLAGIEHLCRLLHRPPTQFELRDYLKMSGSTFSEVVSDTGFSWLPMRKRGRK